MRKLHKYISIALIFFLTIIILTLFALYIYLINTIYSPLGIKKEVTIERGKGIIEIAETLKQEGIIRSKLPFVVYAVGNTDGFKIQAGTYLIEATNSIGDIVKKFVKGEVSNEITLTFPEGITKKEIEKILKENSLLASSDFLDNNLEGYLFPDTYRFFKDSLKQDLISKFRENFDKKVGSSLKYDVLIMASLIEKEVKTKEDKEIVSGILWKRLKVGMPLQVDATITYLTGKKDTGVSLGETKINSPYNTYLYKGLPPTPISNPGLESIKAAVFPKESNFWYYLSTKEGKTIFSKTLEEHNLAKTRYLNSQN